jgi:hypothetical protein
MFCEDWYTSLLEIQTELCLKLDVHDTGVHREKKTII